MRVIIDLTNRIAGALLIVLSIIISIPLTIKTCLEGGGTWGFGVIGLPVLLTLSTSLLFGVAGLLRQEVRQKIFFIGTHAIILLVTVVSLYIFSFYPLVFAMIPAILAVLGIFGRKYYKYYLLLMIILAIVLNVLLVIWEFEFDRTLPLLQLFQTSKEIIP